MTKKTMRCSVCGEAARSVSRRKTLRGFSAHAAIAAGAVALLSAAAFGETNVLEDVVLESDADWRAEGVALSSAAAPPDAPCPQDAHETRSSDRQGSP